MLSRYPMACPHDECGWTGSLVPTSARGGAGAEIASGQRAWFQCPRCARAWEVLMSGDRVMILPNLECGG